MLYIYCMSLTLPLRMCITAGVYHFCWQIVEANDLVLAAMWLPEESLWRLLRRQPHCFTHPMLITVLFNS